MMDAPDSLDAATDSQLVGWLAEGRRDALSALYDRYAPMLLAIGLRFLADREEAEDVVHDVFVEAWRAAGQYDAGRGSVRAWLVTRMRSRAMDRRKSPGRSRAVSLEAAGFEWLAAPPDSLDPDGARVRAALDSLPPEQRQVLSLAYFEGLSCAEIGARTGTPVGTVKSRSAAALTRLRGILGAPRGEAT